MYDSDGGSKVVPGMLKYQAPLTPPPPATPRIHRFCLLLFPQPLAWWATATDSTRAMPPKRVSSRVPISPHGWRVASFRPLMRPAAISTCLEHGVYYGTRLGAEAIGFAGARGDALLRCTRPEVPSPARVPLRSFARPAATMLLFRLASVGVGSSR